MPDNFIALVLLGVTAGVLSGMFGIGGGVIIVPALSLIMGYELERALGTSLAVLIWPVSVFAVLAYYRAKMIHIPTAALIALGLLAGGYFGAQIALNLPGGMLKPVYGIFLLYSGWRFLEPIRLYRQYSARQVAANLGSTTPAEELPDETARPWYLVLGVGLLAGVASGLFGIGGGLVIVPALVGLLNYDQKRAVGTSLAALLPPVGIGGVIAYWQEGYIQIWSALSIAAGLIGGAFLGARLALGMSSKNVKRLYGVFLIVVSFRFIFQLA
ncbi:MAG: sulfite exporter TauE/SafE family protein [Anaerolineae bacterium]|nr:sulfite exporter TauE/SafE family protein [Anaerolineae bacterium]